jgi:CCT motif
LYSFFVLDFNRYQYAQFPHSTPGLSTFNIFRLLPIKKTALGLEFPDDNSTSAIHTITGTGGTISNHNNHDIIGSSGGRNRAFSFECFAFGINADEPLPPLEQPPSSSIMNVTPMTSISSSSTLSQKGVLNNNDTSILNSYDSHNNYSNSNNNNKSNNNSARFDAQHPQVPEQRPRGDSIIFDPASFQDGGIHELLPGLIEQQQQGNDFTSATPSPIQYGLANPVPSSHQYKQQPQRSSYAQQPPQVKPLTSRPPPATIAQNKRQYQPMVTTSSAVPCTNATTTSSAITSQPPPLYSQQRKSSSTGASTPATTATAITAQQQQSQQQDMVTTMNSDGTTTTISLELCNKDGRIGIYLPEARIARIARFHAKRSNRIWRKRIKYDCRKKLADSRPRIKGRFVKRTDMDE